MIRWSIKSLFSEGPGLIASCTGVAFAFLLVLFFMAIFSGESDRITAYPKQVDADIWVMQKGVANMHMAMSQLWDWKEDRIRAIEGVASTESILYLNGVMNISGREWFSYIVGLRGRPQHTGPARMHSGKPVPARGEVVIPDVLARLSKLKIGDSIQIVDRAFRVVGLSSGTFSMANSIVFVSYDDLADIMSAQGSVSYILVWAKKGVDSKALVRAINNRLDKVNVLEQAQFIQNDHHLAMQMGVEIIALMTLIGSALALVIIAFTSYAIVSRKKRDLAIARAVGFRSRQIYLGVLVQALLLTIFGFILAALLSLLLFPLISLLAPEIALNLELAAILKLAASTLLVAVLAALWPAHQVARVDPVSVFHD